MVFRVRPPNYFVLFVGDGGTRSTQETTVFGFCTEHFRNFLRGTQALIVFYFQIAFVSMVFNGKRVCIIPRFEAIAEFRNTLLDKFHDIRNLTVDFLNVIVTVYDDRHGVRYV